ncbi:glycosyl hydrolase family 28-related protein [Streptomyces sp. NPDC058683]|uniref:glycosyl hydrolase family 28-related protein n=1 Tax=Streptomyces sp. NPDC058683 TaxID=3346597 RepID=UPI003646A2F2
MTDTSRRGLLAGAAGLDGTALATTVATAAPAAAASGTGAGRLNVRDTAYGALGDDSADDQPAIQKAIDAAGQGGTVYFPPGRYRIAAPLRLSLGVTLRGEPEPALPGAHRHGRLLPPPRHRQLHRRGPDRRRPGVHLPNMLLSRPNVKT